MPSKYKWMDTESILECYLFKDFGQFHFQMSNCFFRRLVKKKNFNVLKNKMKKLN